MIMQRGSGAAAPFAFGSADKSADQQKKSVDLEAPRNIGKHRKEKTGIH
jgi:hypothetical protein